ncbi:MAG: hypothetical protein H7249_09200 [Chitinophagaceae bacterium]|nr:hypothetical protein [Oligoflexus sp.]
MNFAPIVPLFVVMITPFACTKNMKARDTDPGSMVKAPQITMTATAITIAELPRCTVDSEHMNAYISSNDVYVQCRDLAWRNVKPGDTSANYVTREAIRFHEWTDQATHLRWALPKHTEVGFEEVSKFSCNAGWKLPTPEELLEASHNGLFEGLKSRGGVAFDKAWTRSYKAVVGVSKGGMALIVPKAEELTAGIYCVAS